MEQTCDLLQRQGIKNTGVFEENGVTGGDLLELSAEEMADNLCLTPLQVRQPFCLGVSVRRRRGGSAGRLVQAKKLQNVKKAFQTFEEISITPGKAELSQFELRVIALIFKAHTLTCVSRTVGSGLGGAGVVGQTGQKRGGDSGHCQWLQACPGS